MKLAVSAIDLVIKGNFVLATKGLEFTMKKTRIKTTNKEIIFAEKSLILNFKIDLNNCSIPDIKRHKHLPAIKTKGGSTKNKNLEDLNAGTAIETNQTKQNKEYLLIPFLKFFTEKNNSAKNINTKKEPPKAITKREKVLAPSSSLTEENAVGNKVEDFDSLIKFNAL